MLDFVRCAVIAAANSAAFSQKRVKVVARRRIIEMLDYFVILRRK